MYCIFTSLLLYSVPLRYENGSLACRCWHGHWFGAIGQWMSRGGQATSHVACTSGLHHLQATGDADRRTKVVGMGSCGLDYLAQVSAFPQPDEKLRTEHLEVTPSLA